MKSKLLYLVIIVNIVPGVLFPLQLLSYDWYVKITRTIEAYFGEQYLIGLYLGYIIVFILNILFIVYLSIYLKIQHKKESIKIAKSQTSDMVNERKRRISDEYEVLLPILTIYELIYFVFLAVRYGRVA
jgi:hypothetical protein